MALLAACDDSGTSSSSSGGIVGTWKLDTTVTEEGVPVKISVTSNYKSDSSFFTLAAFSISNTVAYYDTTKGTYSVNGNKIRMITICNEDQVEAGSCDVLRDTADGTFAISGNKLTVTTVEDGETEVVVFTRK